MTLEQLIHLEKLNKLGQAGLLPKTEFQRQKARLRNKSQEQRSSFLNEIKRKWNWWLALPIVGCIYLFVSIGSILFPVSQQVKEERRENPKQDKAERPNNKLHYPA